ncbi:MAG: preprotein translocase subunit SecG [Alphaproteobacteria bacterium]|nr:preprotein translocase subunit SecG [Alphaproteobacteria bacterium]
MENVVLAIHLILALGIILLVLLQRSEGGGLGIGQRGGMGGLASPRGAANFLTRATAICAGLFFITSLILGIMAGAQHRQSVGILEGMAPSAVETAPVTSSPAAAETPAEKPSAPLAKPNSE